MALLPHILSELDSILRPRELFDQHFGDALLRDELLAPAMQLQIAPAPVLSGHHYLRPWRALLRRSGASHISEDKDALRISLDVKQFKPEELSVKVADGFVVVEGKHEERRDEHGFISRHFSRRYQLPDAVDPDAVQSSLSSDGVLMVSAPKKALPAPDNQRTVPITQTQQPAIPIAQTQQPAIPIAQTEKPAIQQQEKMDQ